MAAPTEDQIQTLFNQAAWIYENNRLYANTNTPNFESEYEEFAFTDLQGDFGSLALAGLDQMRAIMSSLANPAVARAALDPILLDYAKQQNFPETTPLAILDRLYTYFAEGSERVTSRAFTYGTPSNGGGNTGDGTLHRLTVDRYAFNIEAATAEVKTLRCTADRTSGANVHQEVFESRGENAPRDFVAGIVGPQRVAAITALSADDSQAIISNPSFNQYDGTAAVPTAITNWDVTTSINNFVVVTTDSYRTAVHEGDTPASLRFEDNDTITQNLSVVRATLNPRVPYYVQIAFKRESSCDGTLTVTLGANSANVSLVAQSGWTVLKFALDESLFLRGFNATTLTLSIALSSRTTGTLLVDDLIFAPMTNIDGTWFALVGGATPYLINDTITVTDTISSDSILQRVLWAAYNRYLPHDTVVSGNVTWSDPS